MAIPGQVRTCRSAKNSDNDGAGANCPPERRSQLLTGGYAVTLPAATLPLVPHAEDLAVKFVNKNVVPDV